MESGIKSSFIPHEAAVSSPSQAQARKSGMADLLSLGALVLFVASAALAVAVFLYSQFLATEGASKLDQLERAKAAFEPSLINELARLDDRMNAASAVLNSHTAPSVLFAVLQQVTLQTVSFQSFSFDAPDPQHMSIKMQGVAGSVNAIALQADLLNKSGVITNPIFSNIARGNEGVRFDLTALVNPNSLRFAQLAAAALSGASTQQQQQQTAPAGDQPQDAPAGGIPEDEEGMIDPFAP